MSTPYQQQPQYQQQHQYQQQYHQPSHQQEIQQLQQQYAAQQQTPLPSFGPGGVPKGAAPAGPYSWENSLRNGVSSQSKARRVGGPNTAAAAAGGRTATAAHSGRGGGASSAWRAESRRRADELNRLRLERAWAEEAAAADTHDNRRLVDEVGLYKCNPVYS
jgi:hypothetical protein